MKRYVAKIWLNKNADKFFGLSHNYHDLVIGKSNREVKEIIETHYSTKVDWEYDPITDMTRGSIEL